MKRQNDNTSPGIGRGRFDPSSHSCRSNGMYYSMAEMSVAEMSVGRNVRGRNVRGRNVLAETSVAEMSVAEMSEHHIPILIKLSD